MSIVDVCQSGLSKLQAIPLVGPVVFSPVKATLSNTQIIVGLAVGIFSQVAAISMALVGERREARYFSGISSCGFAETFKGIGSLFYACVNMATFGIVGLCVELSRRKTVIIHCGHFDHHHPRHFSHPRHFCI